jgi:hypothetical protein
MRVKKDQWVSIHYPTANASSAFWHGVVCGITSTSSIYDPQIFVSYSSPPANAMTLDLARIGGDFRTVVSSGSVLPAHVIAAITDSSG